MNLIIAIVLLLAPGIFVDSKLPPCNVDIQCPSDYMCKTKPGCPDPMIDPECSMPTGKCIRRHRMGDYPIRKRKIAK